MNNLNWKPINKLLKSQKGEIILCSLEHGNPTYFIGMFRNNDEKIHIKYLEDNYDIDGFDLWAEIPPPNDNNS